MNEKDRLRAKRRRRRLNLLLLALLLLLVVVFAVMVAVDRRPPFYVGEMTRGRAELIASARAFTDAAQDLYSRKVSRQDFEVHLTAEMVNGYIAAANDDAVWEHLSLKLKEMRDIFRSTTLENVRVKLDDGRVTIAGEGPFAFMRVVWSITGRPRLDADGRVFLEVERVRAGSLPMPRAFFRRRIAAIEARPFPSKTNQVRVTWFKIDDGHARLHVEAVRRED